MPIHKLAVLVFLLYPHQFVHAARGLTLYRQTLKLTGDSARGIAFRLEVSCENQSTTPQTVTIELLEASLGAMICSNATNLSGWRSKGNCWWDTNINLDDNQKTMVIPPTSGREVAFVATCAFTLNGVDCDNVLAQDKLSAPNYQFRSPVPDGTQQTCTGVPSPCLRTASGEFQGRIRATVTQDKGAVLCGTFSNITLPWSGQVPVQLVTPLNGGRPF